MAWWMGLALAAVVALACATATSVDPSSSPTDTSSSWAFELVPTLILVATVILSLEIWDQTHVSRPLAALVLAALWGAVLPYELQTASLLTATIYHVLPETYDEWTRGFPSIFQQDTVLRKRQMWTRFWMRIFVWAATLATSRAVRVSGSSVAIRSAMVALYCECTEVLLAAYFTNRTVAAYDWRRRVPLWTTSFVLGGLATTPILTVWTAWVAQRLRVWTIIGLLVVVMVVSVRVEWAAVLTSMRLQTHALLAFVRAKLRKSPTTHTGKRRSFLYRAGSDVEVVGMPMHYEAYDFRHKHHEIP